MPKLDGYAVEPGWRALLRDLKLSEAEVLLAAGLPGDLFRAGEGRLSSQQYFALWRALETCSKDPLFPLHACEHYPVESFHPPLFAALSSPNLDVALERLGTYKALIGPTRLTLRRAAKLTATLTWLDPPPVGLALAELGFLVRLARIATRERIDAVAVTVAARELELPDEFEAFFGVKVTAGSACSVSFRGADAARPFVTRNEQMWEVFEPALRRRLADLEGETSTAERVRAALLELLPAGQTSVAEVSRKLALSTRTLQRRLTGEGTSFALVLETTRRELALNYLRKTGLAVAEISFLLGFAETSSFFRAFHGWTGRTPQSERRAAGR